MNTETIGDLLLYESLILKRIAHKLITLSKRRENNFNYIINNNIEDLNDEEHKIIVFLYSIHNLDLKTNSKTLSSIIDICNSVFFTEKKEKKCLNICRKLCDTGLINIYNCKDNIQKYYISKYGIFLIHCEKQQSDWNEDFLCNITLSSIDDEINNYISLFFEDEINYNNNKKNILSETIEYYLNNDI